MNTRQMDCILELSKTLNFGKAAANLFISQPTLTYQVSVAEQEVGFKIFDRSGRGTTLTSAGAQFAASLRGIRAELRKAIEQWQNFSARYRENLRIAMPARSVLHFLPDAIRRVCQEEPGTVVSTTFNGTTRSTSSCRARKTFSSPTPRMRRTCTTWMSTRSTSPESS